MYTVYMCIMYLNIYICIILRIAYVYIYIYRDMCISITYVNVYESDEDLGFTWIFKIASIQSKYLLTY